MQDNVEISNPMYQSQELDEDLEREFTIDSDRVSTHTHTSQSITTISYISVVLAQ